MIEQMLGQYRVLSKIGEGGMGEVYRARDTKLKRDVAIKILPDVFARHEDRVVRFTREAQTLASLNHPNIAQIYGTIDEAQDGSQVHALVMELVEGEDLSTMIARHGGPGNRPSSGWGPGASPRHDSGRAAQGIPLADALPIARQIADALEAAHEQGIIHRDLKPGNIKVRPDGTVKVLDFGLAKALAPADPSAPADAANSPTVTVRATQMGLIIGTAAYMAPEQARGKAVDKRADVWAFGAVLYEMLTGARAFPGEGVTDTLAAVVRAEPDWSRLPAGLPPTLVVYLRRCLEKDPKQRVPGMATMRLALEGAFEAGPVSEVAPAASFAAASLGRSPLVWALGAVAVISLGVALFAPWGRPDATARAVPARLSIVLPPGAVITSYPAITPDGRTIAYVAQQGAEDPLLYLRDLDSFDARVVAGSTGARQPFFSPDGRWVAFFAQGQLLKAELLGGTAIRVVDAASPLGGTWMADGTIIYAASLGSGLLQVPAAGGAPKQISKPDGASNGYTHVFPQALPGGRSVLFSIFGQEDGSAVMALDSGTWQRVLSTTTFAGATYDTSAGVPGRLLVTDETAGVRAAPFDPARPAPTTADVSVLDNVYSNIELESHAWLAVSQTGTAVYVPGDPAKTSLVWVDRNGAIAPLGRQQDAYREVSVSPDGTKAAIRQRLNLWVLDLARGTNSPLTSGHDSNMFPVWSRDGRTIAFGSNRGGDWDIYWQPADGAQPAEVLLKRPGDQFPFSFAPDGTLLYSEMSPTTGEDLWTLSPDGKASPLRVTRFNEWAGQFSPEAGGPRWIAYASNESGRSEIYVESYPGGARRIPVSTRGGETPVWSPDGRELYYQTPDAVEVVAMQPDGTFGEPRTVVDRSGYTSSYSVSPDRQRLLMIHRDEGSVPRQLNVILNWTAPRGR